MRSQLSSKLLTFFRNTCYLANHYWNWMIISYFKILILLGPIESLTGITFKFPSIVFGKFLHNSENGLFCFLENEIFSLLLPQNCTPPQDFKLSWGTNNVSLATFKTVVRTKIAIPKSVNKTSSDLASATSSTLWKDFRLP